MKPFKLSLKDALPKMRAAYVRKRLGIQNNMGYYRYDYGNGLVCIIGAALPPRYCKLGDTSYFGGPGSIDDIRDAGIVSLDGRELRTFVALQEAHDRGKLALFKKYFNTVLQRYGLKRV